MPYSAHSQWMSRSDRCLRAIMWGCVGFSAACFAYAYGEFRR